MLGSSLGLRWGLGPGHCWRRSKFGARFSQGPGTQLLRVDRHLGRSRLICFPVPQRIRPPMFGELSRFLGEFDQLGTKLGTCGVNPTQFRRNLAILVRIPSYGEFGQFRFSAASSGACSDDAQSLPPALHMGCRTSGLFALGFSKQWQTWRTRVGVPTPYSSEPMDGGNFTRRLGSV